MPKIGTRLMLLLTRTVESRPRNEPKVLHPRLLKQFSVDNMAKWIYSDQIGGILRKGQVKSIKNRRVYMKSCMDNNETNETVLNVYLIHQ